MQLHARKRVPLWPLVVTAVIFAGLYAAGVAVFFRDSRPDVAALSVPSSPPASLTIHSNVVEIDPVKRRFQVSVDPIPRGNLTTDGGISAAKDVRIDIATDEQVKTVVLKADQQILATSIDAPVNGSIWIYPFDRYQGGLEFASDSPMRVLSESQIQAYHVVATIGEHSDPNILDVEYSIGRSQSVVAFAVFLYLLMALVAMVVVVVTICVVWNEYQLDFGHMTWGAAMLFVLPGVRSGLPGQPPIGTIGDFLVFFWAEVLVVACTVTLVFTWVKRSAPKPQPE